jgi:hypothetical protein
MEFKHSNGKGGPDLKDRRKAMIEQIYFLKRSIHKKHTSNGKGVMLQCRGSTISARKCLFGPGQTPDSPRAGAASFTMRIAPAAGIAA